MPKQCWKCRTRKGTISFHHINGNHNDVRKFNLINLCSKCHDVVQGICDKCQNQRDCYGIRFCNCWRFEDALPPIYYRVGVGIGGQETKIDNPSELLDKTENDQKSKTSMMSGTNKILKNYPRLPEKYNHKVDIYGKCELCSLKCKTFGIGDLFYCKNIIIPQIIDRNQDLKQP